MDKRLFQSYEGRQQFIAIPLKHQEDSMLNPQPNFIIVDNIYGYYTTPITLPNGETVTQECRRVVMRVVYREMLEETSNKEGDMREVTMDSVGLVSIPFVYEHKLRNHEALIENEELINEWLTLFDFRGFLKDYVVEYDKTKS